MLRASVLAPGTATAEVIRILARAIVLRIEEYIVD
jgi:hypothetical protein